MRIEWKLLGALFSAEVLVMFALACLPRLHPVVEAVADAALLVVLASLPIWWWVVRPLRRAHDGLELSNAALEKRVDERTAELLRAKDELEQLNAALEERVDERTAELQSTLSKLESSELAIRHSHELLGQSYELLRLELLQREHAKSPLTLHEPERSEQAQRQVA
jgi:C4-dicarboxylate-specific signal transduction histidine kinase